MTAKEQLAQFADASEKLGLLCREYERKQTTVHLKELAGGAFPFYAAAAVRRVGGLHVFVADDRDAAAYLLNDFYNLLDERRVYFFPTSYKRSAAYGAEDAQGVVQRTAALGALRAAEGDYTIVCTYPEALAERVADAAELQRETIAVRVGDSVSIAVLEQCLADAGFVRVDFVYEPGQYSVRGGIVDVFSYSESKPPATGWIRSGDSRSRASCRPNGSTGSRSFRTSTRGPLPPRRSRWRVSPGRMRPGGSSMRTMRCAA